MRNGVSVKYISMGQIIILLYRTVYNIVLINPNNGKNKCEPSLLVVCFFLLIQISKDTSKVAGKIWIQLAQDSKNCVQVTGRPSAVGLRAEK